MLTLNGKLLSVLRYDERTMKTGEVIPARIQAQIQTEEVLEDGQIRLGLQTITLPTADVVKGKPGTPISLPVRAYASGRDVRFIYNPVEAPAAVSAA